MSAWIGFQAQSLISIDNIGIAVWGWLLGGAIIGLSNGINENLKEKEKNIESTTFMLKNTRKEIDGKILPLATYICRQDVTYESMLSEFPETVVDFGKETNRDFPDLFLLNGKHQKKIRIQKI